MPTLESVLEMIAQLSPEDREKVREYLQEPRTMTIYTVPGKAMEKVFEAFESMQQDTEEISEEDLDSFIREVVEEVRQERYDKRGY